MTFSVNAVEVRDLYQASALVDSQSANDRRTAIKQAMENVLIKVSGQKDIAMSPDFKKAINKPEGYYLQYRYENQASDNYLVVDFDEVKINQLFKSSQQALWGSLRPQVLLWLVEEQSLAREITGSSSDSPLVKQIKLFAKQRGLPLILPLMDLHDMNNIDLPEVWGRFSSSILAASARYQAEKVVVIRVSDYSLPAQINQQENCALLCKQKNYAVDWSILEEKQVLSDLYQGTDTGEILATVIDDITDHIYQQYALSTDKNNEILLDVNNIDDLSDYAKTLDFLTSLSSVQSVILIEAQGAHRRFKLKVLGTKQTLMASLKLSRQLVHQVDPLAAVHIDDIPVFYWQD
ncbi:MAG: DUF2066 domain-containing protein [Thalassotalea sp.]